MFKVVMVELLLLQVCNPVQEEAEAELTLHNLEFSLLNKVEMEVLVVVLEVVMELLPVVVLVFLVKVMMEEEQMEITLVEAVEKVLLEQWFLAVE
tara:strand:+ start:32 stop:316 length:285 start_codon:yes stop_codon:yes gene_type:complete